MIIIPRVKKQDWILTDRKILGMRVCHDATFQDILDPASYFNHTLKNQKIQLLATEVHFAQSLMSIYFRHVIRVLPSQKGKNKQIKKSEKYKLTL